MAVPIAAIRNPEHAVDGPHRTANTGADRAANHSADGPGDPAALISSLAGPTRDALRVGELWNAQQHERHGCER
jgi:hypothetical protein